MPVLILASTSASRRKILEDAGVDVICEAPGVDERGVHDPEPESLARTLAERKAAAVGARHRDGWVLGADQVVWDGREVFGKPRDPADHVARLTAMRGASHELITAFCLLGPGGVRDIGVERTRMYVRADLGDDEIAAYVATGEGSSCAGGYAAEARGAFLFERVDGDWFNVLGLPLFRVLDRLRAHGWRFPGGAP